MSPESHKIPRKRDERAFERFLRPYRGRLLAYLRRSCTDPEEAEDCLQELMVRAWRSFARYEPSGRADGWLFSIAHSVVVDTARRRAVRPALVGVDRLETVGSEDPGQRLLARELGQSLRAGDRAASGKAAPGLSVATAR